MCPAERAVTPPAFKHRPPLLGFAADLVAVSVRLLLWVYRVTVSPLAGPCCRFAPSCSVYAGQAIARYGIARGGWMAVRRLFRCHPFHPGGWDPVP
jgi:putative membrane protein insertion efficiency factor